MPFVLIYRYRLDFFNVHQLKKYFWKKRKRNPCQNNNKEYRAEQQHKNDLASVNATTGVVLASHHNGVITQGWWNVTSFSHDNFAMNIQSNVFFIPTDINKRDYVSVVLQSIRKNTKKRSKHYCMRLQINSEIWVPQPWLQDSGSISVFPGQMFSKSLVPKCGFCNNGSETLVFIKIFYGD